MWLGLQKAMPDNFILATGCAHSVREFFTQTFEHSGLRSEYHVEIDNCLIRPAEGSTRVGDATMAVTQLGSKRRVPFQKRLAMTVGFEYVFNCCDPHQKFSDH